MATRMQQIGRYEVERELGRGAMGVVYLARDTRIGRSVALKTIRLSDFADAEKLQRLRERLVREAQSAGILSHENIVTVYDVDEQNGLSYISMEFVEGDSLEHMLERRRELSREMLLSLLRQIADALDFAHSRGIVHRDIKPPNIMVTPNGRVKITDFGIAKVAHASSMTQGGGMLGTPDYMSPEQIGGSGVDGRSDQFSLGVIAFELLSGERPFVAETLPALFYRIAHQPSPDATLLNRSLSPEIGSVLERAMAKNAGDRFPTCFAFIEALSDACAASPGWHALPRGMSQTLPTLGDAARGAQDTSGEAKRGDTYALLDAYAPVSVVLPPSGPPAPPPVIQAPVAQPPAAKAPAAPPIPAPAPPGARAADEPVWVPTLPPPRMEAPPVEPPYAGAGGFITAGEPDPFEVPQPEWLRDVHAEEQERTRGRRRGLIAAIVSLLLVGGALAAVYFGIGGIQVPGFTRSVAPPSQEEIAAEPPPAPGADGSSPTASEGGAGDVGEVSSAGGAVTAPAETTPDPGQSSTTAAETGPGAPEPSSPTVPAPVKPQRPERPTARLASVRFMSDPPGAEVTVDANAGLRCETPCSLDLPVGRHTYSLRLNGYRNEIKLIDLKETGETVSARLERHVGLVRVASNPAGASVFVNGEPQEGITPLTLRLVPGTYRIRIEKDGRRIERNVSVSESSAVQIDAELQ